MAKKKSTASKERKEAKRPTESEKEARIQFAIRQWLNCGYQDMMLLNIRKEFDVTERTAQLYLARAREVIGKMRDKANKDFVDEVYARSIDRLSRCETVDQEDRVERTIMDLLGLKAPVRVARTTADGKDVDVDADERRVQLRNLALALADGGEELEPADAAAAE